MPQLNQQNRCQKHVSFNCNGLEKKTEARSRARVKCALQRKPVRPPHRPARTRKRQGLPICYHMCPGLRAGVRILYTRSRVLCRRHLRCCPQFIEITWIPRGPPARRGVSVFFTPGSLTDSGAQHRRRAECSAYPVNVALLKGRPELWPQPATCRHRVPLIPFMEDAWPLSGFPGAPGAAVSVASVRTRTWPAKSQIVAHGGPGVPNRLSRPGRSGWGRSLRGGPEPWSRVAVAAAGPAGSRLPLPGPTRRDRRIAAAGAPGPCRCGR